MISSDALQLLTDSYIAKGLTQAEVEEISSWCDEVTFAAGDPIFRQFDESRELYIVLEGKVAVNASNGDLMARVKPCGVFGEISFIDHHPRSASVTAEADVKLLQMNTHGFQSALDANSVAANKLLRNISQVVCARIRSANVQIEALLLATGMDI